MGFATRSAVIVQLTVLLVMAASACDCGKATAGESAQRKRPQAQRSGLEAGARGYKPPKGYEMFKSLSSKDEALANYAAYDFAGRRDEAIESLINVLESRKTHKVSERRLVRCIRFLGHYLRARRAVKPIVELLAFRPPKYVPNLEGQAQPYEYYPAAAALAEIGQPAARSVVRVLASKRSTTLQRKLATWVLLRIEFGNTQDSVSSEADAEVKRSVLCRLSFWQSASRGQSKRNFDEAIKFVKSYKQQIGPPEKVRGFFPK